MNRRMKTFWTIVGGFAAVGMMTVAYLFLSVCNPSPAYAASPVLGSHEAKAGTVVVPGQLAKWDSNYRLVPSIAYYDQICGVIESNAGPAQSVIYAPAGTEANVIVGAAVTRGALLTSDANGYAVPVSVSFDANLVQRIAGVSLGDANGNAAVCQTVRMYVMPSGLGRVEDSGGMTLGTGTLSSDGNFSLKGNVLTMASTSRIIYDSNLVIDANGITLGRKSRGVYFTDGNICITPNTVQLGKTGSISQADGNLTITGNSVSADKLTDGNLVIKDGNVQEVGVVTFRASTHSIAPAGGTADANLLITANSLKARTVQSDANIVLSGDQLTLIGAGRIIYDSNLIMDANGLVLGRKSKGVYFTDGNTIVTPNSIYTRTASFGDGNITITATGGLVKGTSIDANTGANDLTNVRPVAAISVVQVANTTVGAGIPFVVTIDANTTGSYDYTVPAGHTALRVIDGWFVNIGASDANTTVQLLSTGNAITDAATCAVATKTKKAFATFDEQYQTIAAGGKLRFTYNRLDTKSTMVRIYALCIWE